MRMVSFNVNSVRVRLHQLQAVIEKHAPAVIGIQETKVTDEEFPVDEIRELGYHVEFHGQKTHYGVALLSRDRPAAVMKGFNHDDETSQRRFIRCDFSLPGDRLLTVINGYFPQGENRNHAVKFPGKQKFYADLQNCLIREHRPDNLLIVMGDMNVAPVDNDIGIGDSNMKRWLKEGKACFLPEEREWLQKLIDWGMVDTFRARYPDVDNLFSWFDYRSRGFERDPKRGLRIDLILASTAAAPSCTDAGIDNEIRAMNRPSDHCPVWCDLSL
jgi:exodeoxyribonuclease III